MSPLDDVEVLLLDLDDTLLDHGVAQERALAATLRDHLGALDPAALVEVYTRHNAAHWQAYERGEVTPDELRSLRWATFLEESGLPGEVDATSEFYVRALAADATWMPGAREALPRLAARYRLAVVTNGFSDVARPRLASAGIDTVVEAVVVSGELGVGKPDPAFFDATFARLGDPPRDRVAIVGDSLTSDMAGGRGYGITTVWVNARGADPAPHPRPDLEVRSVAELARS